MPKCNQCKKWRGKIKYGDICGICYRKGLREFERRERFFIEEIELLQQRIEQEREEMDDIIFTDPMDMKGLRIHEENIHIMWITIDKMVGELINLRIARAIFDTLHTP